MRTTLALEDDLYSRLEDLAHKNRQSFKVVVNESLRRGLDTLLVEAEKPAKTVFATPEFDLSACRYVSLDNVHEVLAVAEGEGLK